MKLSTKVRYAVRALAELANHSDGDYVPLRKLAESQQLSMKYLEKMAAQLKVAGLLQSTRGAEGGYRLARSASDITVWDIYCILDISTELVDCRQSNCADGTGMCSRADGCSARELWTEVSEKVRDTLQACTLADLAARDRELQANQAADE